MLAPLISCDKFQNISIGIFTGKKQSVSSVVFSIFNHFDMKPPPPFRRCPFGARPLRTGRGAEEMRGKVEASIDQPQLEQQATKGMA